jgi:tyrosine-protein kinase Etk/Wzc
METELQGAAPTSVTARAERRAPARVSRSGMPEPTIRDLGRALAGARWLIAGTIVAALAVAGAYLFLAPRVYRSVALVALDDDSNAVARLESPHAAPVERDSRDRDIEMLRARRVVGTAVDRLSLDVSAKPRRVPLLGDAVARVRNGATRAPAPPLLSRLGWGGERIALARLEVPPALVAVPLTLVALGEGRYRVLDPRGVELATGEVGRPARSDRVALELVVKELAAQPGTEFRIERLRRDDVIDELLEHLTVGEKGRKSGVLEVALQGAEPVRVARTVDAIVGEYVRRGEADRAAEVGKALDLVQAQLGPLRAKLEAAEEALAGFKLQGGLVDLAGETKALVDRVAELQKALSDLEAQRESLRDRYTDSYPGMVELAARASAIRSALQALGGRLRELPGTELRATRLAREVTVAAEQYVATLNQIRAMRVLQAGDTGPVKVVDAPVVARKPVVPRPGAVLVLALLLGAVVGVSAALVRGVLWEEGDDSQEIEDATGLPIFATVPHSEAEARLHRLARAGARASLATVAPDDLATENLRTLRTVLAFLLKARGNIVAVTSPTPRAGKTFVVSNLGQLLAAAGKRVLVVDADLRRGTLHRSFALSARPGLGDVLVGGATLDQAVRPTGVAGLDLVACGSPQAHPAELLAGGRLDETLKALSGRYDVILVDTAPTLAVTDAVLVGRCAALNLIVLRSRQHPVVEIEHVLERFRRSGVQVHGAIVNDARAAGRYGRAYEHRASDATSGAGAGRLGG